MKFRIFKKKILIRGILLIILLSLFSIYLADHRIASVSKKHIFKDLKAIPENKAGLILGTSKYLTNGQPNLYFTYRIKAAIELYQAQKVHCFVVSGDNSRSNYNESQDMKDELVRFGVPDSLIYLDYAGFRTLDSVVRMNKIFGQKKFTVISQQFHNERAVFLARQYQLDVCGYNAKDVDKYAGFKTKLREKFARVKVFVDMISGKEPRFLGDKIRIE